MKKMMKYWGISFLAAILCIHSIAQPGMDHGDGHGKKMEQLKIAFITDELDLTVEESQKFWPIYNEFDNAKRATHEEITATVSPLFKNSESGEKDLKAAVAKIHGLKTKEIDAEQQFILDCIPVLGVEKARKLMIVEEKFRRELLREMKKQREHSRP